MSKPIIRKLAPLKNLGVFKDCPAAQAPTLRRYNLIYGFNGSGKTTLSRVFGSLEAGKLRAELPEGGTFEVELNDGTVIKSAGDLSALSGRLLVFNVDFIEENFKWKEGTANPVFYLGREQAELAKTLEEAATQRGTADAKRKTAQTDYTKKEAAFSTYKRDAARVIADQLNLGRRYDASNLVSDYSLQTYDEKCVLADDAAQQLRTALTQKAPLAKRDPLNATAFDLATIVNEVSAVLGTTLGTITIDELRGHDAMLNWIKDGVTYHEGHNLTSCLFCGNNLTQDRLQLLRGTIDDKFDQLIRAISTAKENIEKFRDSCVSTSNGIPSSNDISEALRSTFSTISGNVKTSLSEGEKAAKAMLDLLAQKSAAPNSRVDSTALIAAQDATIWDNQIKQQIGDFNKAIEQHNAEYDNFDKVKTSASKKLKEHYLANGQSAYAAHKKEVDAAKAESDRLDTVYKKLQTEEERLKKEVRKHGPAAKLITDMVHSYLGRRELEIAALENGYELRRAGKPIKGSLSEGEKTAIAFCYFLSTLEAEGRKRKDLIVVVDDPVSSLDTKALNYSFSILKSALGEVGQLFLLTHNLNYMNEAKKWLKNKTEQRNGADPTAALLFLDAIQNNGEDSRSSCIKELPKYIRDYESEYQYLFHLVSQFANSPDGLTGYLYVMPNAMRKVLEIFLAFKLPGCDGLSSKVEAVTKLEHGLDDGRIRALDRLVQVESHADNLDDLVTFSSMTVEETKDAADALLKIMSALDKPHYDRLVRICN